MSKGVGERRKNEHWDKSRKGEGQRIACRTTADESPVDGKAGLFCNFVLDAPEI